MPLSRPEDVSVAVVGDGFGSLIVYATSVYLGFAPGDITIYGTNTTPVGTYQQFAYNLGQTVLRSESESHFLPADWPTFAQLDAYARGSFTPLARSIRRVCCCRSKPIPATRRNSRSLRTAIRAARPTA